MNMYTLLIILIIRKDLLNTQKSILTLRDFMPSKSEYHVPIVNRIVAIDMMVNTVKFLQYEHRDASIFYAFDMMNVQMW